MKRIFFLLAIFVFGLLSSALSVSADRIILYEGRLLNTEGYPVQTAQYFRFSLWDNADFLPEAILENGSLNPLASGFENWQEEYLIQPGINGTFSFELGRQMTFPPFSTEINRFLQIEVRPGNSDPNEYQILDPTGDEGADENDRKYIASVPSALFSERSQEASSSEFTIDPDDILKEQNSGQVRLRFGDELDKFLAYDLNLSAFFLNASLIISGDLTVQGAINGVSTEDLIFQSHTQNTDRGTLLPTFRINMSGNGVILETDNLTETRTVTFDDADTHVVGTENTQALRNKTIDAQENTITNITPESLQIRTRTIALSPDFPSATIVPDGSNNMSSVHIGFEEVSGKKFYQFSSEENALQDLSLKISIPMPNDFIGWEEAPISINIKSDSTNSSKNNLTLSGIDTAGNSFSIASDLVSSSGNWEQKILNFGGGTFEPGKTIILNLDVSVSKNARIFVGDLTLQYQSQ